ncbi:hypothetical protein F2K75_11655 [Vibrio cholerae]|nr:hypothetical protein [Vibrio cholerae]EGR2533878.1 hypothetical protein [Vibrio cholerae]EGR5586810.1 hypothetical protein [Vibrio cholerae]
MDSTSTKRELPLNLDRVLVAYCAISAIGQINTCFVTDYRHRLVDNTPHFCVFIFSPRLG